MWLAFIAMSLLPFFPFGITERFARVQTRRDSLAVGAKVVAVVDVEVRVDLRLVAE